MSLVVGYADKEIACLVADTLLTFPFHMKDRTAGPVNGQYHALKIHILTPNLAVAFAGHVNEVLEVISRLNKRMENQNTIDIPGEVHMIYKTLVQGTVTDKPDCEFLVLEILENGNRLSHVTLESSRECERAYIGDGDAYRRVQALIRPYVAPKKQDIQRADGSFAEVSLTSSNGESAFMEIANAMEAMVHERGIESVGAICGNVIRVVNARLSGKLEYLQSIEAGISPEEGRFGFTVLADNSSKRKAVALYFFGGKFGYLLRVGDEKLCWKESSTSLREFIEIVAEKYGIHLVGGTWDF